MVEVNRRDSYEEPREEESASVSWVARIASGIGLVLFLGSVGILGYEGLFRSGGDPVIALSVESVTHDGQRWLARVRAENTGGETGAQVRIAGQLMTGQTVVETAEAEFTYIPAGSTQEGGLFFDRDPKAHELRLRVLGYAKP
ncbi:hypothetical protein [Azospirillum soli]|uniref:hypothetical protein n=1 Tax=Azospirillum soli TaxID=1304799 RepID=UPI001AE9A664|nr:hypothetical protein [Azospirillum soli]MBP2314608.1 uncharacterized protein (TIGR02588 family) [Azospirillum soli]